jgi:hypothetical protein
VVEVTMLDKLREIETASLEKLLALKAEHDRLRSFMDRAKGLKAKADPSVYERVQNDYQKRLSALDRESEPLRREVRGQYGRLRAVYDELRAGVETARMVKEELEFRHEVGELAAEQLRDRLEDSERKLAEKQSELDEAEALRSRFLQAFGSEEELNAPAARGPSPIPPAPPPVTPRLPPAFAPADADEVQTRLMPRTAPASDPLKTQLVTSQQPPAPPARRLDLTPVFNDREKARLLELSAEEERTYLVPSERLGFDTDNRTQLVAKEVAGSSSPNHTQMVAAEAPGAEPPDRPTIALADGADKTNLISVEALASGPLRRVPPPPPPSSLESTFIVPEATLVAAGEGTSPVEYHLGVMNYIGRTPDNQIQLTSPGVSRKHAVLLADPTGFTLKDLESQNGTYVNDQRITECLLTNGDRIRIGRVQLLFRRAG